jgi:hypothetical protein
MDNSTMIVLVIIVFALVAIAAYQVYRRRARVRIKGPLGTEVEIDASNESASPAVRVSDAKSRSGGLAARDETGRGVEVSKVEVERDITATSTPPKPDPKA